MHADQVPVDADLARRLVDSRFPQWSDLPIRSITSGGTDNAVFRLGDDLALRIPITLPPRSVSPRSIAGSPSSGRICR